MNRRHLNHIEARTVKEIRGKRREDLAWADLNPALWPYIKAEGRRIATAHGLQQWQGVAVFIRTAMQAAVK